jgi:DNA-binding GntR family transcriptional regulator
MVRTSLPAAARRVLTDEVYEIVKEALFDQRLAPGERVNIDALSRELGVSPTPLREALARLEAEGFVVKQALRGYTVAPLLDDASFGQLYDFRLLLEPESARLAAPRITREQLKCLAESVRVMERSPRGDTYQGFIVFSRADGAYHDAIAEASGNRYIVETLARLRSHDHLARLYFERGLVDADRALPEHRAILEALREHNAERASTLMRAHIDRSRTELRSILPGLRDAGNR